MIPRERVEDENARERIAQTGSPGIGPTGRVPAGTLFGAGAHAVEGVAPTPGAAATPPQSGVETPISLDDRLREVEADLIGWALRASAGNKSRAAKLLKVKRSTLGDRINRCGLGRPARGGREDPPLVESSP